VIKNHWIMRPWNSQRPDGGSESFGKTAIDIKVAMFVKIFPNVAKNTRRLIGFLKKGKHTKVVMMIVEPMTESPDAALVAMTSAKSLWGDSGVGMFGSRRDCVLCFAKKELCAKVGTIWCVASV